MTRSLKYLNKNGKVVSKKQKSSYIHLKAKLEMEKRNKKIDFAHIGTFQEAISIQNTKESVELPTQESKHYFYENTEYSSHDMFIIDLIQNLSAKDHTANFENKANSSGQDSEVINVFMHDFIIEDNYTFNAFEKLNLRLRNERLYETCDNSIMFKNDLNEKLLFAKSNLEKTQPKKKVSK